MKQINRREFLLWMATTGLTLREGIKMYQNQNQKEIEEKIYGLNKYVHLATHTADSKLGKRKVKGVGIYLDDYYISMAHIYNALGTQKSMTPFGIVTNNFNFTNPKTTIGDVTLENIVVDNINKRDVFVGKANRYVVNFPCKPTNDIKLGDDIYVIGNPQLFGSNIRKGKVSDLDGLYSESGKLENTFGIDIPVHPGDSGSPVVNDKYELLGLAAFVAFNKFGYINKIKLYTDTIQDIKNTVTKSMPKIKEELGFYENKKTSQ